MTNTIISTEPKLPAVSRGAQPPMAAGWYRKHVPEVLGIPAVVILIIAAWAWAVPAFNIRSVILPSPLGVWKSLVNGLTVEPTSPASYYYHAYDRSSPSSGRSCSSGRPPRAAPRPDWRMLWRRSRDATS